MTSERIGKSLNMVESVSVDQAIHWCLATIGWRLAFEEDT